MANVTVSGYLMTADGTQIPLQNTTQAEGTEFSLTTNATYTNQQVNVGDYAPGQRVVSGLVEAPNGIAYAFLLRQGVVLAHIPVSIKGNSPVSDAICGGGFTLQAGDIVRCMVNTASDREAAVCVYTNQGVSRIFVVTPTGAATNEPVDLQTGNSVGDTLQGQVITKAWCTSVDASKIDGGGVLMLNQQGMPVGSPILANFPIVTPIYPQMHAIPCALNFKFAMVTTS